LGDKTRCADVLQVTDSAGLLLRWYVTPAEREALVLGSFKFYFAQGATAPALQRCRHHEDDACTALLQSLPPGALPRPLDQTARMLLVREALRAGGRGACRRLVAAPNAPLGAPLAGPARMLLVREALRAGGRDAYRRLVANPNAPLGTRLASAAGMSLDSLVTRWRARVLAARPQPLAPPWTGAAAFGWTAFFALCALRS